MRNKPNLINKRFGKLLIISSAELDKSRRRRWNCKCDCGKTSISLEKNLLSNNSKSCGNCHTAGEIQGQYWCSILYNAKVRNIEVQISSNDAWNLFLKQDRKCALSGEPLFIKVKKNSKVLIKGNASLDRIDSSKGYTLDNIQWVTIKIQKMKNNLSDSEFIQICKQIASYNV